MANCRVDVRGLNRPKSQQGIALVITLILLSVITFMAIAFLVLSQGQKGNVATYTDQSLAKLAADTAFQQAQAQLVAPILATGNPYDFHLLVSTNYINPAGFFPNVSSPTNVNYDFVNGSGTTLTLAEQLQNLTNLLFSPRPPVFLANPITGINDFRYYLDLNRNGIFDATGPLNAVDNFGKPLLGPGGVALGDNYVGDPQWIGGLEFPDRPHSANNQFIYRYAYLVAPASETLDINYIHNQAANPTKTFVDPFGGDYRRNQGVGTWEINLASLLYDLNTNTYAWGGRYVYQPLMPSPYVNGNAFVEACSILTNRYGATRYPLSLASAASFFQRNGTLPNFTADHIDDYSAGPIMTGYSLLGPDPDFFPMDRTVLPWPGAYNTNHFFSVQDLFNPAKSSIAFTNRLLTVSAQTNSYDRYTFYRLLSSLGTDSAPNSGPTSGKIDLNYANFDTAGRVIATPTNLWNATQFFTNAAKALLINAGYSVGRGLTNLLLVDNFGQTNFQIQIWPTNFYSPSLHQLLQLAANIYDASSNTNQPFPPNGIHFPSVFRPLFRRTPAGVIFIAGYREVKDDSFAIPPTQGGQAPTMVDPSVNEKVIPPAPPSGQPIAFGPDSVEPLVYGVPLVVGARKGFPNFNEFSMQTYVYVSRLLEFRRSNVNGPVTQTNVMYVATITNTFGLEAWNSYETPYSGNLRLTAIADPIAILSNTNDAGKSNLLFSNAPPFYRLSVITNIANWSGWTNIGNTTYSFELPWGTNANFTHLQASTYVDNNGRPFFEIPLTHIFPIQDRGKFPIPRWALTLNTHLRFILTDPVAHRIVDYVNLNDIEAPLDINSTLINGADCLGGFSSYDNPGSQWCTNRQNNLPNAPTMGILNQIGICLGLNGPIQPPPTSFSQDPYAGLDGESAVDGFRYNLKQWGTIYPKDSGKTFYLSNVFYAPFDPYQPIFINTTWQANDPLVHYTIGDLLDLSIPPTNRVSLQSQAVLANLGQINNRYEPWGGNPFRSTGSMPPYQIAAKDPLVTRSDDWDFPTNKFPNVGWLGRVHRGTPWQTVFLKSANILYQAGYSQQGILQSLGAWQAWSGNPVTNVNWGQFSNLPYYGLSSTNPLGGIVQDAIFTLPTNDWRILDLFTTAANDNAARGKLSVNNTNLAAWSAMLSGVNILTNMYSSGFIEPAGVYSPLNPPPLVQIVNGIINARTNFPNKCYQRLGDILAAPELTMLSPYLPTNPVVRAATVNDEVYERIPQQILGLLHGGDAPRFVIYSYGQALKPAAHSLVTSGAYLDLCTNYQITAESATRAVVRIDGLPNNPHAVVESFNVLPPD